MTFGLDIGTTSVSGVKVDDAGSVVGSVSLAHCADVAGLGAGVEEQSPQRLLSTVDAVCTRLGVGASDAIGWTGQMHGVVAVDRELKPLTNFVTWRDARRYGGVVMSGWAGEGLKAHKCLSVCSLALAARMGRAVIDPTFLHAWYPDMPGVDFPRNWLPEVEPLSMIGDNQAGVFAARRLFKGCAVVNIGTSAQLSVVLDESFTGPAVPGESAPNGLRTEKRPYPGGKTLLCRAAMRGGRAWADLRAELGFTWDEMNATDDARVGACADAIVEELVCGIDLAGVEGIVGLGNGLMRNPALKAAVERRFNKPCLLPEVAEMAAYGAALFCIGNGKED